VPGGVNVGASLPQVTMPTEPVDGLSAHAAEARATRERGVTKRRRRRAEA
jgi:hypothetical protein